MVKIRLWRAGAKNQPFYRIVAIDSRAKRDGAYLDILGTYNPIKSLITLNEELISKWINQGAKPTETVKNIFLNEGVYKNLAAKGKVPIKKPASSSKKVNKKNNKTK